MKNIKPKQLSEAQIQLEFEEALDCHSCGAVDDIIVDLIGHIKYQEEIIEGLQKVMMLT